MTDQPETRLDVTTRRLEPGGGYWVELALGGERLVVSTTDARSLGQWVMDVADEVESVERAAAEDSWAEHSGRYPGEVVW